jgi:DNA-binding XRE family transcriptional regulator
MTAARARADSPQCLDHVAHDPPLNFTSVPARLKPVIVMARAAPEARHDGRFAERIRRLRLQQGLTQAEVARAAGISRRSYINWEHGDTVPYPGEGLRALATVFRVLPLFLLFGEEEGT